MNVTKDKISLRPQTTFSACRQGASRSLLCFPSEKTEDAPLLYDPPAGRQVSTSTRSARRWCTHPSATPRRPHRQLRARMAFRGNEAFDFGDILAEVDNGEVTADSSSPEHTPDAKTLETLDGKLLGGGMGGGRTPRSRRASGESSQSMMGLGDGVGDSTSRESCSRPYTPALPRRATGDSQIIMMNHNGFMPKAATHSSPTRQMHPVLMLREDSDEDEKSSSHETSKKRTLAAGGAASGAGAAAPAAQQRQQAGKGEDDPTEAWEQLQLEDGNPRFSALAGAWNSTTTSTPRGGGSHTNGGRGGGGGDGGMQQPNSRRLTLTKPSPTHPCGIVVMSYVRGQVEVARVEPGSLAEAAGIRPGDVILRLCGEQVTDHEAFAEQLRTQSGDVSLELATLPPQLRPPSAASTTSAASTSERQRPLTPFGLVGRRLSSAMGLGRGSSVRASSGRTSNSSLSGFVFPPPPGQAHSQAVSPLSASYDGPYRSWQLTVTKPTAETTVGLTVMDFQRPPPAAVTTATAAPPAAVTTATPPPAAVTTATAATTPRGAAAEEKPGVVPPTSSSSNPSSNPSSSPSSNPSSSWERTVVRVSGVAEGGLMARAGLRAGDLIHRVNGLAVVRHDEMIQIIKSVVGDLTLDVSTPSPVKTEGAAAPEEDGSMPPRSGAGDNGKEAQPKMSADRAAALFAGP